MRGAAVAAALVGAALVLSGCQYLLGPLVGGPIYPVDPGDFGSFDPGEFGSFDPNEPGFSIPPPAATYQTGSATVTIGDSVTTLDRLAAPGSLMTDYGGERHLHRRCRQLPAGLRRQGRRIDLPGGAGLPDHRADR